MSLEVNPARCRRTAKLQLSPCLQREGYRVLQILTSDAVPFFTCKTACWTVGLSVILKSFRNHRTMLSFPLVLAAMTTTGLWNLAAGLIGLLRQFIGFLLTSCKNFLLQIAKAMHAPTRHTTTFQRFSSPSIAYSFWPYLSRCVLVLLSTLSPLWLLGSQQLCG